MNYQPCLATHTGNPPEAHAGLRLCTGDYDDLTDALTGPAAATDTTIEAVWGYTTGYRVVVCSHRAAADRGWHVAVKDHLERTSKAMLQPDHGKHAILGPPPALVCGDGTHWYDPRRYRPGGLARDWAALQLRDKTIHTGEPAPYVCNGAAEAPLPIDAAVADIRLRITHALAYWVRQHVTSRNLAQPDLATIYQTTAWLATHKDWAAAQDWAGTYADNLHELRTQARRIIDLPQPRHFEVAPCICIVDGHPCPGTLSTIAREPRDPTPVVIRCDTCPAAYDSPQWKRLSERLQRRSA